MKRLADTPLDHPALWGEVGVAPASSVVIENHATLLPHLKKRGASHWWLGHQHGGYNERGEHIEALNDLRGQRQIFQPPASLEEVEYDSAKVINKELVIYGGTIFDHFGHLLLDLTRLYQMARIYRGCKSPIWVHVHSTYPGRGISSPLAHQWLSLLGLEGRVKVIRKPIRATSLVSSSVLYRDRGFVSEDFYAATSTALAAEQQKKLNTIDHAKGKIAYLSRHKLTAGTTKFIQEGELVQKLQEHPEIDIICAEELNFEQKLALYRRYSIIAGFPQACMNLKAFVPQKEGMNLAKQVMLIAGPQSLSSNWINIDLACKFNDYYVDCPAIDAADNQQDEEGFQRGNQFDVNTAYQAMIELIKMQ